jgi:hypothetical protein
MLMDQLAEPVADLVAALVPIVPSDRLGQDLLCLAGDWKPARRTSRSPRPSRCRFRGPLAGRLTALVSATRISAPWTKGDTLVGSASDVELRMPWEDAWLQWLADPKETERKLSYFRRKRNGNRERVDTVSNCYCFPGPAPLEFDRDLVLNHVLLKRELEPRRPLRGFLLASGELTPDLCHEY